MLDILMAFFDLVPVGLFLASSILLQRCLYNKMSKGAFAVFSSGTIFVFVAGVLKALHKILFFLNICNWKALSQCFFPMQTVGFVLAGAGLLAMMLYKQGEGKVNSFIAPLSLMLLTVNPDEFNGTMVFVALMVLGVALFNGVLIIIAAKQKQPLIIVLLVVAFICTLGMGYLSTKDDLSDWIKEFVNSLGQASLFVSVLLFKKHGLEEANSLNGITKY